MTTYNESQLYRHMHNRQQSSIGAVRIEAARSQQNDFVERRYAEGAVMPTFYLILELTLMLLLIYSVSQAHVIWLTIIAVGMGLYFLASSSLPRYQAVLLRQKKAEA